MKHLSEPARTMRNLMVLALQTYHTVAVNYSGRRTHVRYSDREFTATATITTGFLDRWNRHYSSGCECGELRRLVYEDGSTWRMPGNCPACLLTVARPDWAGVVNALEAATAIDVAELNHAI